MEIVPLEEYWDQLVQSRSSTFIGLLFRVPPRFWRKMSKVQEELREVDRRQVYAKPSTLHVTIKGLGFLGEKFDESKLEALLKKISSLFSALAPFEIRFRGLGVFPTSIYVKVEDPLDQFRMINKMISHELGSDVESSNFDGDAYLPHVTLATFTTKEALELLRTAASEPMKNFDFGESTVFEIEAVGANMFYALGPEDTQEKAFSYIRSFMLGNSKMQSQFR